MIGKYANMPCVHFESAVGDDIVAGLTFAGEYQQRGVTFRTDLIASSHQALIDTLEHFSDQANQAKKTPSFAPHDLPISIDFLITI